MDCAHDTFTAEAAESKKIDEKMIEVALTRVYTGSRFSEW
jgi:hypothetical protein